MCKNNFTTVYISNYRFSMLIQVYVIYFFFCKLDEETYENFLYLHKKRYYMINLKLHRYRVCIWAYIERMASWNANSSKIILLHFLYFFAII